MAYTHAPLPRGYHTRVLELYPAPDPNTPLRGNFRYVNLDTDPFYDAISYTWGDPDFTESIFIGGGFRLPITANLRDALIRYRHPTAIRSIWADAICIDQANKEDKRKQIPLMKDIFRCASSVLAWLGTHPPGEACLRDISLLSQRKTIATTTSDNENILSLLNMLVSLAWFSRRWVIQEIVLNPNVTFFCGTISVPWLRIALLLNFVPKENSSPPILHLHALREMWDKHNRMSLPNPHESESETGIVYLLSSFSDTDCADARDRIYALAGLASDVVFDDYKGRRKEGRILVRIDYTRSVQQVYHEFAMEVTECWSDDSKKRLLLETSRRSNGSYKGDWLSWVPDWRLPTLRSGLEIDNLAGLSRSLFNKRGTVFIMDDYPYCIGEIQHIISVPLQTNVRSEVDLLPWVREIFASLKAWIENNNEGCQLDGHRTSVIWRLLASVLTSGRWDDNWESRKDYFDEKTFLEGLDLGNVRSTLENRNLFIIPSGEKSPDKVFKWPLVGVGPCHMRVGDVVCHLTDSTRKIWWCSDIPRNRGITKSKSKPLRRSATGHKVHSVHGKAKMSFY
ncbi:heterokaryon incompatibility protein-domain-containing protein [Xylaria longipes]|nr:heterokaryon incompatibility protein-domain-containing protein [Xylaria longipes]